MCVCYHNQGLLSLPPLPRPGTPGTPVPAPLTDTPTLVSPVVDRQLAWTRNRPPTAWRAPLGVQDASQVEAQPGSVPRWRAPRVAPPAGGGGRGPSPRVRTSPGAWRGRGHHSPPRARHSQWARAARGAGKQAGIKGQSCCAEPAAQARTAAARGAGPRGSPREAPGPGRAQRGAAMGSVGAPLPTLRWEQIRAHDLPGDKWLVIERRVYDISRWAQRHPGGSRLIGHHGAEDATVRPGRGRGAPGRRRHLPGRGRRSPLTSRTPRTPKDHRCGDPCTLDLAPGCVEAGE